MSEPIDTDEFRELIARYGGLMKPEAVSALDEIDRLRAEVANLDRRDRARAAALAPWCRSCGYVVRDCLCAVTPKENEHG